MNTYKQTSAANTLLIKSFLLLFLAIFIAGCNRNPDSDVFKDQEGKASVILVLSHYNLDSIPKAIGELSDAQTLTISLDSLNKLRIYSPDSTSGDKIDSPPFKTLPNEITELTNLKSLIIHGLNISRLPDNFSNLNNLEYLDLSMNKLTIANEMSKLKKLTNLKYLGLFGNKIDTVMIYNWQKENPKLQIYY